MKAAVLYEYGKPLVIEDVEIDPPGRGEVKVRVGAAGICHSDIHGFKGQHGTAKLPLVGGHEVAGYVDEVGKGVTSVKAGDPVIVSLVTKGCGKCYFCRIGAQSACEVMRGPARLRKWSGISAAGRYVNKKGQRLSQQSGKSAGFAEYTTVGEEHIIKIPGEMPMDRAAIIGCGVISGFYAVTKHAQVKPLSSVVVIGIGGVGLNVIQGAIFSGAYPIIAIDVVDSKLRMAKLFGATHTIISRKEQDPIGTVFDLTSQRGADYVFVAVAGTQILRQGFEMSGWHGMTVILGHGINEPMNAFQPVDFVSGDRIITGCAMGGIRMNVTDDIPALVELYQTGHLKLDELISRHYSLEQINEAIEDAERGDTLRNVIMF